MSLDSDIEELSQVSTHHGVAVCKNTATKQAYCFFSEDRRSLQFAVINASLQDVGYDDIHFLPFSSRENWCSYHPTAPLADGEVSVQGNLN